jgi:hypothetical protein
MVGTRDDDVRMVTDRRLLHRELPRRPARHCEIQRIGLERGDDRGPIADFQPHFDRRVTLQESGERLWRKVFRGAHHADRYVAAFQALQRRERLGALGERRVDARGGVDQLAPRGGRDDPLLRALQQRHSRACLELPHLHGNRWRREMQRVCRG